MPCQMVPKSTHACGTAAALLLITASEFNLYASASTCVNCLTAALPGSGWCIWQSRCTSRGFCQAQTERHARPWKGRDWLDGEMNDPKTACPILRPSVQKSVVVAQQSNYCWKPDASPVRLDFVWSDVPQLQGTLYCYFTSAAGYLWTTLADSTYERSGGVHATCPCPSEPAWATNLTVVPYSASTHALPYKLVLGRIGHVYSRPLTTFSLQVYVDSAVGQAQNPSALGMSGKSDTAEVFYNIPRTLARRKAGPLELNFWGRDMDLIADATIQIGIPSCHIRNRSASRIICEVGNFTAAPGPVVTQILSGRNVLLCRYCSLVVAQPSTAKKDDDILLAVASAFWAVFFCLLGITIFVWVRLKHTSRLSNRSREKLSLVLNIPKTSSIGALRRAYIARTCPVDEENLWPEA